jgi:uncharacterized protein (TIGR02246 family)
VLKIAVAAAVIAAPATAALAASNPTMAQRLQVLEDKEAIRSVLERFYQYEEDRDLKAFANLFAKDGQLILRRGVARGGPAGILASMSGRAANAPTPGPNAMRHILSNIDIDVQGDSATATSRFTLLVPAEDNQTRVGGTGRYIDTLVRENGEWKFEKRVIARDIPVDLEGKNPPASATPTR